MKYVFILIFIFILAHDNGYAGNEDTYYPKDCGIEVSVAPPTIKTFTYNGVTYYGITFPKQQTEFNCQAGVTKKIELDIEEQAMKLNAKRVVEKPKITIKEDR